jgi:hypothetical protein
VRGALSFGAFAVAQNAGMPARRRTTGSAPKRSRHVQGARRRTRTYCPFRPRDRKRGTAKARSAAASDGPTARMQSYVRRAAMIGPGHMPPKRALPPLRAERKQSRGGVNLARSDGQVDNEGHGSQSWHPIYGEPS